jgi:2-hydroxycyclohexanecarboxyl-CoA dehydrogenase
MPVAMITGGASLIGEGIGRALIGDGWTVVVTDIDLKGAQAVAKTLGNKASAQALDVTDPDAIKETIAGIIKSHGSLDGLVNAAGGLRRLGIEKKEFTESTPDDWWKIVQVNLEGVMNCVHAALPPMMAARKGAIVSIASNRGLRGMEGAAVHSGAKAGVIVFTQNIATEAGPFNVRINTVVPGRAEARWKAKDDKGSRRLSPLGRHTSAEDVGNMVRFLMSDQASHVTGACFDVSGGTAQH